MTLKEELTWRGLVNQTTYKDLNELNDNPITFYWGVDPSADSMTIGNLAAAMMVKCFMRYGHKPVLLIGGATGLIGDPDGKSKERDQVSQEQIQKNKEAIVNQYKRIFGGQDFELVDNYDWFKDLRYLDFLRDVGKHVPMRQMLARDFVESRLGEGGSGISYAEFSYVLIQAYDFLHLFENKGVTLQVCGADQWGNSIAGVDLIRRKTGKVANVFSTPLIIDPISGQKFGKTEGNAVWLDPNKTSPTQFYQFWINVPDDQVESLLKIYTELSEDEIKESIEKQKANQAERPAQRLLAASVTKIVHGEEATKTAETITNILVGQTDLASVESEDLLSTVRKEIPSVKVSETSEIAEALVSSGLASSKSTARQLVQDGAISLNGQKVNRDHLEQADFKNGRCLIRRGKAFKDSGLLEL
ncbi:MAG TPA: tyrosine--tRNA ligase [Candidatus Sulfotelmatobacter sp.]|nr:tyrosine--tRNA ligase [Candidatus Sulfotelmatobacter sp.]